MANINHKNRDKMLMDKRIVVKQERDLVEMELEESQLLERLD